MKYRWDFPENLVIKTINYSVTIQKNHNKPEKIKNYAKNLRIFQTTQKLSSQSEIMGIHELFSYYPEENYES